MNLRLSSIRAVFVHQDDGRLTSRPAAAAALAFALAGAGVGSAIAAPADAASAPDAASVSYVAGSQYTVRPGQSLNDVAIAVTQSHDRATLVRASRALFDANPNAFMGHDPSRMRVGALLTVPALDASGALAASSAAAQAAAAASAPSAAVAVGAASGAAQANVGAASVASAASAAANASAPAAPAVSGAASAAAEASSAAPGSAAVSSATPAPTATSQAGAAPVSDAHEWSGSIQPPASAPTESAPAPAAAQSASQPRAQVSSLQQLLALKNRVLMELQKHGIGGAPAATSGTVAAGGAAKPAAGTSSAVSAGAGPGAAAPAPTSNSGGMSQKDLSIAAAVGAALVVLLAALRMRRRKREDAAAAEAGSANDEVATSARISDPQDDLADRASASVRGASSATNGDAEATRQAAALAAAERAAAEKAAAEREAAERTALERAAAERAAEERATAERAAAEERAEAERAAAEQAAVRQRAATEQAVAAERAAAERAAADQAAEQAAADQAAAQHSAQQATTERAAAEPASLIPQPYTESNEQTPHLPQSTEQEHSTSPASFESAEPAEPTPPAADALSRADSRLTPEPLPAAVQEAPASATTAASLAAAAELGAEALPLASLDPVDSTLPSGEPVQGLQSNDEPARSASATPQEPATEPQNHLNVPSPVIDFTQQRQQHIEPRAIPPLGQPYPDVSADSLAETSVHAQPTPAALTEFPRDAVDAFSSLDMPLPPRVESAPDGVSSPASLSTQPAASPETTAQQAVAPHELDDVPHIADEIAAGTTGHAAVAGLGAAGFGALKLDFDLELPPSPAQPLPAFTQADLVRIARNKLDLASEYIELGDLAGARSLINEVIEVNDPATRTEARALLSTLAPLS